MGSQWFCKVLGQEVGPVSFRAMAEMVRSGTLKADDPVRREAATEWTRAKEVIGLLRAAAKKPATAAAPGALAEPKPSRTPPKAEAAKPPSAQPRRIGKRRVLLGGGIVALVLLAALISAWRSSRRETFPEPLTNNRPVLTDNRPRFDAPLSTAVQSPGRFAWDFRQGVDEQNMACLPGSRHKEVCRSTPEGLRCTLPLGFEEVRYCGLRLRFDLRGDFEVTAGYQIHSLPMGEPRSHPGVKLAVRDSGDEIAMMERHHLHGGREIFTAYRSWREDGQKRYESQTTPTDATSGKLRLRRSGTTIHYLFAAGDSEEFVELWSTEFPSTDVEHVDLAAQTGAAPTGIDMVWTDLDIQADALVGIAGK